MVQNKPKSQLLICSIDDYVPVNRCFKYIVDTTTGTQNKRVKIHALCVQENKLKESTATITEYKCTNCMLYTEYNQSRNINADPSLKQLLQNINKTLIFRIAPANKRKIKTFRK